MVRFANVFDITYNRFLDLQKAEEQASNIKLVNQENERLLHSILPQPIAEEIRSGRHNVVKRFEEVSILFADIVGFTVLSEKLKPGEVVDILNGLFSKFDDLTDQYGLEKIKTIGDAYMVAAGVPEENADHAMTMFRFAQDMLRSLEEYNLANNSQMKIRIGISSGPVVAGVIGKKKFAYDLWGDSVNTAARMEAYGREGNIQISPSSYALLKNDFAFEKIPGVNIKGKGVMDVYLWKPQPLEAFSMK
ncbi:MAG: adenylate/guanylate cyclase domain-containing protein [Lewinellaceae bacterium]|nr:adenylate/guanylate cyclase domain-containing protein [Lewinellaceae bacterium]